MARLFAHIDATFPLITGSWPVVFCISSPKLLVDHPGVAKVSFTGSEGAGRQIAARVTSPSTRGNGDDTGGLNTYKSYWMKGRETRRVAVT